MLPRPWRRIDSGAPSRYPRPRHAKAPAALVPGLPRRPRAGRLFEHARDRLQAAAARRQRRQAAWLLRQPLHPRGQGRTDGTRAGIRSPPPAARVLAILDFGFRIAAFGLRLGRRACDPPSPIRTPLSSIQNPLQNLSKLTVVHVTTGPAR